MGADYYAHAAIGLRVKRETLQRKVSVPAKHLSHCVPNPKRKVTEDDRYCPGCGVPLVEGYEIGWIVGVSNDGERFLDYRLIPAPADEGDLIIALRSAEAEEGGSAAQVAYAPFPGDYEIDRFKTLMLEVGLWRAGSFGVWAVLEISV